MKIECDFCDRQAEGNRTKLEREGWNHTIIKADGKKITVQACQHHIKQYIDKIIDFLVNYEDVEVVEGDTGWVQEKRMEEEHNDK